MKRFLTAALPAALSAVLPVALALAVAPAIPLASAEPTAPPALVGHWRFDEGTGTTAADAASPPHPGTLRGGATWADGVSGRSAVSLDGRSGHVDMGAPVLDTTHSFTVAAWVRLTATQGYRTAVSIDGSQVSGFYLQFRDDTRRFAFTRLASDDSSAAAIYPSSTFEPAANTWYHLTGVHDAAAGTLALYVNGTLQQKVSYTTPWKAAGPLVVGRGKFGGRAVDFFAGQVDDVRVYDGALAPGDVRRLSLAGHWGFEEGDGTTAADGSPQGNPARLAGGARWVGGVVGRSAVEFDGATGQVTVASPVVNTAASFTVAAWARFDDLTGYRTVASVDGNQVSGFYLQFRDDTRRFAFTRPASDGDAPATFASSRAAPQAGRWYHLAGVYDAGKRTLALYVDGVLQQTVSFTSPWKATGDFAIGRGRFAGEPRDWLDGAVDDVRVYPVALSAPEVFALTASGYWRFDEGSGNVAADSSPSGADGTLHDVAWTSGAAYQGIALDGRVARVDMGDAPSLDAGTGPLTIAAWFRTASRAEQRLVSHGADGEGSGYALGVTDGRVTFRVGGPDGIVLATRASRFADGAWHHAAAVVDRAAGRALLYLDGEPQPVQRVPGGCAVPADGGADIGACADANGDSDEPFTVGSASGGGRHFAGSIDEVAVFRYPLTVEQVRSLAAWNSITIAADTTTAEIPSTMYGLFLEEISHSGDGGLYAELVRNRTFKESDTEPAHWSLVTRGGTTGEMRLDFGQPLNRAMDRSLRLHVDGLAPGQRVGVANSGYWGIAVRPGEQYRASFFAKASPGFRGRLVVALETQDGRRIAERVVAGVGPDWRRYQATLVAPAGIHPSTANRFVVYAENGCAGSACPRVAAGDLWFSVVSLFPPTYRNRPNGLRVDLMEKLAALKPGFFRVPGGNYLEGDTIETRFKWWETVGPVWERPGHMNTAWGYWSTDGLGLLEYLRMAEDLGAEPILAVYAGYSLNGSYVPPEELGPYIQEVLDELEYVLGPVTSRWGAQRARDGHPKPFALRYVEIGNEDWFDRSGSYEQRYAAFYDAIKARYPHLRIIATTPVKSRPMDVLDEHFYQPPQWFADNAGRYDRVDRNGPKILVGEYGALDGRPTGTLRAAVGEAAFLTGLERNADVVIGSTFAPLFVNENAPNWSTNLIGYDAGTSYGSPSYWVQRMFTANVGEHVVDSRIGEGDGSLRQSVTVTDRGGVKTLYVKVVNPSASLQQARISIGGVRSVAGTGTVTVLTGDPAARNTLGDPDAVRPTTARISGLGTTFSHRFPPYSVTVLTLTAR